MLYFLLNAFSLACAIRIVSAYVRCHAHFLANYESSQQLDCRENWICAYRIHQFSQNNYPTSIDSWIPLLLSAKLNACLMEINLSITEQKSLWLIGPSFGKDFDDEVVAEQLTAVVDVTFMHAMIWKYPNM